MEKLHTYKNLKVIVTGSTGFKGSWLCFWLHHLKARVVGIGLKAEKEEIIFKSLNISKKIKQIYLDINNFKKLNEVIKREKPDIIFHLAAQAIVSVGYKNPLNTFETNLIGSVNILESVRLNKIGNLVYITSDKCYLNDGRSNAYSEDDILGGEDPYSASKAGAEIIFHSYQKSFFKNNKKIKFATGRAGNVIGGGDMKNDGIIPDIIRSIKLKRKLVVRNPKSIRPWQHVLEALSGYLVLGSLLIKNKLDNSCYPSWNFGPKGLEKKTVIQLVKEFLKTWEIKKSIYLLKSKKFEESKLLILDSKKATRELKWRPRLSFKETINLTVQWYKSYFLKKNLEKLTVSQINYYTNK